MSEERVQRRLAAILAADVVGYSRLMGADEEGTHARLNALRSELLHPKVSEYGGRIVKTTGDGTLIEFPSAVDAVNHAIDVQRSLIRRNAGVDVDSRIELRVGINVGDVIVEEQDIFGDGVNVAARLEALAEPGGICVSGTVYDQVRGKLSVPFRDLGERSLKNIAEPVRVIAIPLQEEGTESASRAPTDAVFRRPSVAVLPFENMSGDSDQEYFADGLTEDIITALSLWRSFPVIARNSTFAYKGQSPDVRRVGTELGARYVVEGSVRKAGNRVRVTAQLINAETGHHVWAERYDRDMTDIFDLQDEITQRIAGIVAPELERAEHQRSVALRPQDMEAWDLVLKGMALLNDFTEANNSRAREAFEQAIALDPDYSRAYTGLAFTYNREVNFDVAAVSEQTLVGLRENARRAVQLDGADWFAHWMLGLAYMRTGNRDEAYLEALRSVELNPSSSHAYSLLGGALTLLGRPDEGIPHLEKALALAPNDPRQVFATGYIGRAHFTARRYGDAAAWLRKAQDREPDMLEFQILMAACLGHQGKISEAQESLRNCERLHPRFMSIWSKYFAYREQPDEQHLIDGLRKAGWDG